MLDTLKIACFLLATMPLSNCELVVADFNKIDGSVIDTHLDYYSDADQEDGNIDGVTSISCRGRFTCVLTTTGGVKCWGWNDYGQLGDGTTITSYYPVDVAGLLSGVKVMSIGGAGGRHNCALLDTGGVKCWGSNEYGQLGDATTSDRTTPVYVSGLLSGVSSIHVGSRHTCAIMNTGAVKCWGWNEYGQLGNISTMNSSVPVDVDGLSSGVISLTAGGFHTCVIMNTGASKCWGDNYYGQLGNGETESISLVPIDVVGLSSGVTAISAGGHHTCSLSSGGVKCWGRNEHGQIGDGTLNLQTTPVDVYGLSMGVHAISVSALHTCVLMMAGSVKCWGNNESGQLGDGTTANELTPTDVVGLSTGVTSLSTGYSHNCAILASGKIMCWGENLDGELGDGTNINRSTPVEVQL